MAQKTEEKVGELERMMKYLMYVHIFSSFSIPEDIVRYLTKEKIDAMAKKGEDMDILNPQLKIL